MKKLFCLVLILATGLCSCTKDLYTRPVTIDRTEFTNKAGGRYEEQFERVNGWFLQKIKALEVEKHTFRVDTAAPKRYRKYNHTLVASLEELEVDNEAGLYYQLYLRPNSGIGKIKGNVQHDRYNELKLYSPEKSFLRHGERFYKDSIVAGPFNRLLPVQAFLEPLNSGQPDVISFSIDSINFQKGFKKRHKESISRLIHNSIVLRQQRNTGGAPKKGMVFDYYPNFNTREGKVTATYSIILQVTQNPVANKITVSISSPGYTPEKWHATEKSFNRRDFLDGHTYEANYALHLLAPSLISNLYYSQQPK